jgi:hypothetical protein
VKSTLRFESIAAPHFPHTSARVSLIGLGPFYYSMAGVCLVLQFCYAACFFGGTAGSERDNA